MRRLLVLAGAGLLAAPGSAWAAAPANDAPTGATGFSTVTAENGTPTERQGVAELAEATVDLGVARCLGPGSFERTVWFRVPAATTPRQVRVTGTGGVGQSAAQPDLAAFVVAPGATTPTEPQACDGGEVEAAFAGSDPGGAPQVDVRVPAGQDLLVQVGRPAGQAAERVVLGEAEAALPATPAPAGDVAGADTPRLTLGTTAPVALAGATLTAEDPAQPACPASATVWRRLTAAADGTLHVKATGDTVSAVTAFVGSIPTADGAVACRQRSATGTIVLDVPAKRGDAVWVRLGTETTAADAPATLTVDGPGAPAAATRRPKVSVGLVGHRRRVRLRATGGGLRAVRVTIQRRRGSSYATVATASLAVLPAGRSRTVTLKRRGSLSGPGRFRLTVRASTTSKPARRVRVTRTKTLRGR